MLGPGEDPRLMQARRPQLRSGWRAMLSGATADSRCQYRLAPKLSARAPRSRELFTVFGPAAHVRNIK
jgi:hypothetical protein